MEPLYLSTLTKLYNDRRDQQKLRRLGLDPPMIQISSGEKIFSFGDLVSLFHREKRTLLRVMILSGLLMGLYGLMKAPKYAVVATFKESAEKKGADSVLKDIMGSGGSFDSPQAAALMKSYQVLKPLVCKLGMQATVSTRQGKLRKAWGRLIDNVRSEFGLPLSEVDIFRFSDLSYEGENVIAFQLRFLGPEHFEVHHGSRRVAGKVGEKIDLGIASFTISNVPKKLKLHSFYPLSIRSWINAADQIRGNLQISNHKLNKSIFDITFPHRDRVFAAEVINALMQQYQTYLKQDHDQLADDQLAYLEQRQKNLFQKFDHILEEHAHYLQNNIGERGFLTTEEESGALLRPYQELFSRVFTAEVEMDQLTAWKGNGSSFVEERTPFGMSISRLNGEIQELTSQRDLIGSSLYFRSPTQEIDLPPQKDELLRIRSDLQAATVALDEMEEKSVLPLELELFHDPNRIVQAFARHIAEERQEAGDLALYLRSLVRLFSVREKILQERQFHQERTCGELEGIDLETAKELIIATSQQLDQSKASIQHYLHLENRIEDPAFELSALSAVLKDPVSQKLLERAAELQFLLKDDKNHSEKESERHSAEMALERKILAEHLHQLAELEELNTALYQDKMASLQQISLDCINRQVSVNQEQIADLVRQRKELLIREKQLLENKMEELRKKMLHLPEKWRAENLLEFKTDLGIETMKSVAQLVESKTIGHHLHHVESKPLDYAYLPYLPVKPRLLFFSTFAALLGGLGAFFFQFLKTLHRGFPVTGATLEALSYPCSGSISSSIDGPRIEYIPDDDLESLRKLLFLIDEAPRAQRIALFCGEGPDYSHTLANLLAQSGRKVLIVCCDFSVKFSEKDLPGLLQVLKGEEHSLPIRSMGHYDLLPNGGYTRFATELFRSPSFSELLRSLKSSYDHILLFSRATPKSAESKVLLEHAEKAFVTIFKESIELLTPFAQWAYDGAQCRLTFLTTSYLL